ncbi:hypothetical protein DPMN_149963 [Dreissena polymorpha]|uniref:Uncharacterized protein n=1 Tax=Dreissena polymorpha TaxID=45954 RepID=A0A9D4FH11_DREPO|nr:hypothetical protein DPMN_149963 [Dreissena polymorpha]
MEPTSVGTIVHQGISVRASLCYTDTIHHEFRNRKLCICIIEIHRRRPGAILCNRR